MPIRMLLTCLLVSLLHPASVHAGARLAAMAGDGLLLADADADHLWPAALADHAPTFALRGWWASSAREVRPRNGSMGPDIRVATGRSGRLRAFWRGRADSGPAAADGGVQAAWRIGPGGVGMGWTATRLKHDGLEPGLRRALHLGVRLEHPETTIFDLTLSYASDDGGFGGGALDVLRLRVHRRLAPGVIAAVAYEDVEGPLRTTPGRHAVGGLLFWPDPDLQILVAWREETFDISTLAPHRSLVDPALRRWADGSRGPHVAAEVRMTSWMSWRSGARILWPRSMGPAPKTWLGLGGSLHVGRWDAVLGWSRRELSTAPGIFPTDQADSRIHLDVIHYF